MRYANMRRCEDQLRTAYPEAHISHTYDGPQGYTIVLAVADSTYTIRTAREAQQLVSRAAVKRGNK